MKLKTAYAKLLAASKERKKQIDRMRKAKMTWKQVGAALGISTQRAHKLGSKK